MRLAVVGKGGAGKSVVSGTLARAWAQRGDHVLAVDLDANPGLALSLGIPLSDEGLPGEAVEAAEAVAYGYRLRPGLTSAEAVDLYSQVGPDEVRFLQIGNIDRAAHSVARNVVAIRGILRGFDSPGWQVIGDLEAGPTTPFEGYIKFADLGILVVEPSATSILAGRRLAAILRDGNLNFRLVANQVRDPAGAAEIRELAGELGSEVIATIPFDPAVADSDRLGVAPIDHAPQSPAVLSIKEMAATLSPVTGAPR